MRIPPTHKSPLILRRDDGRPFVVFDATPAAKFFPRVTAAQDAPGANAENPSFTAIGYRQTKLTAFAGGKANANGFRVRNEGMASLTRTFRGQAFISGHDWGDARARGGTIRNTKLEQLENGAELGILYEIELQAAWAKEGLANGTIDRFSFGISPVGEIMCTAHCVPVWSTEDCYCWPGEMVSVDQGKDKAPLTGIAEFEFENANGLELSAVNVPAVEGTHIVNSSDGAAALATVLGRVHPRHAELARMGGYTQPIARRTMAACSQPVVERSNTMDRVLLCKTLGLPETATDEQILAAMRANAGAAAQTEVLRTQLAETSERERERTVQLDAAHVDSEITRLRASRKVSDKTVANLRAAAKLSRASFDSSLAIVEEAAPEIAPAAGAQRSTLQSDAPAAVTVAPAIAALDGDGPDAFDQHATNPELGRMMRFAKLSVDHVRKHGAREWKHVPNIQELADNTAARGDRAGVGK